MSTVRRSRPSLSVVNPSDDGHEIVENSLFNETVFTMKTDRLRVMFMEKVEGVDNRICITKESEDALLLFLRYF